MIIFGMSRGNITVLPASASVMTMGIAGATAFSEFNVPVSSEGLPTLEPLARRPFKNHKLAAGGAPVRRLTGATLSHLTQRSVNRDSGHFSPDPALSESIKFPLTRPQESNIFMSSA